MAKLQAKQQLELDQLNAKHQQELDDLITEQQKRMNETVEKMNDLRPSETPEIKLTPSSTITSPPGQQQGNQLQVIIDPPKLVSASDIKYGISPTKALILLLLLLLLFYYYYYYYY
jgi:hypothetical protein